MIWRKINPVFVLFLLLTAASGTAFAQSPDIDIEELTKLPTAALDMHDEAQQHFKAGFAGLDRSEYLAAADILENLLEFYGTSPYLQDTYFELAEIYHGRLQGDVYAKKAIATLEDFIETFPYLDKCLDAQLTICMLYFRHLNDLDNTLESLQTYFAMFSSYNYLESEKLQGQVLLANVYQKMGKYGREQKIWEGLVLTNPSADRTGRAKFLAEIGRWKRIPGEGINLFFHTEVSESKYTRIFSDAQDALESLQEDYSTTLPGPVELFLYPSVAEMLAYTSLDIPLTLDSDRTIHLAIEQSDQLPYLLAYIFGSGMDLRSRDERHPLMRGGFEMIFYEDEMGNDIDHLAARYLLMFDESPGGMFFLRESTFFGSREYDRLAGSFLKYLSTQGRRSSLVELYRGLTPRHTAEMVDNAFRSKYGKTLDELVDNWFDSLRPLLSKIDNRAGFGFYDLTPIKVDQSSPEKVLESYFDALRIGDFDALADVSVSELGDLWREAKETYEDEGILEEVRIVEYVYPWFDSTYKITRKVVITESLLIYTIEITREGGEKSEANISLSESGGKWYIEVGA